MAQLGDVPSAPQETGVLRKTASQSLRHIREKRNPIGPSSLNQGAEPDVGFRPHIEPGSKLETESAQQLGLDANGQGSQDRKLESTWAVLS